MKKIFNTIILSISVLFMSSCLKSTDIVGPDAPGSAGAIIEFANPTFIATSSHTLTVPLARYEFLTLKTGDKVHVDVNYTGTNAAAPSNVTVNLTTDAGALTTHLTQANRTTYVALPTTLYTLPASVTIPSGQNKAGFDFTITDQFVANTTYAVALKIASASAGTVSGNFGTIVVALKRVP
ncbi:DUF1735 domain-containing protein [Mucilaginibacter sp. CSA2-8R]|uniref:DUF1735 domain-containing protein n=1 Tax=Mucilaginibacter sp. CSA2-8R TaxID=3141542 RepID=UPI00315D51FD